MRGPCSRCGQPMQLSRGSAPPERRVCYTCRRLEPQRQPEHLTVHLDTQYLLDHSTVNTATGCWEWAGATNDRGYAQVRREGRALYVHRLSYESLVGPIPVGLTIDHLCRTRNCVRPDHLEPVTLQENVRRSPIAPNVINAAKTHCINGHEFTASNTYIRPDSGGRQCRACSRSRDNHRRGRRHAARLQLV